MPDAHDRANCPECANDNGWADPKPNPDHNPRDLTLDMPCLDARHDVEHGPHEWKFSGQPRRCHGFTL